MKNIISHIKILIIGLGYVGLPLLNQFSKKKYDVSGYDTSKKVVKDLSTLQFDFDEYGIKNYKKFSKIKFSTKIKDFKKCNVFIVTVPTPVNKNKKPELKYINNATESIAKILKVGDIVIYESTFYPGLTEEFCVPILQKISKLKFNKDFFCGYSPERINPGDKKHTINNIVKITSGSNKSSSIFVDNLYKDIINAGTYNVSSIKIAEAAKIIENTQRDINIALINELSRIFNKMNINTNEVLKAASTKWNFIKFQPGLVGGHCIGVDPFYLTYKSKKIGYSPKMILAGRSLNDDMSKYITEHLLKKIKFLNLNIKKINILIMGVSFKENCSDIRNSKIIDLYNLLIKNNANVDIYDPLVSKKKLLDNYSINLIKKPIIGKYNVIVIALAHKVFLKMKINYLKKLGKKNVVIYDLKSIFKSDVVDFQL